MSEASGEPWRSMNDHLPLPELTFAIRLVLASYAFRTQNLRCHHVFEDLDLVDGRRMSSNIMAFMVHCDCRAKK
jgi:hypothetical protein